MRDIDPDFCWEERPKHFKWRTAETDTPTSYVYIDESYEEPSKKYQREKLPAAIQVVVWERDGGRCVNCGSTEELEFDHIIPLSKGGANTIGNIQVLCRKCNAEKSDRIGG